MRGSGLVVRQSSALLWRGALSKGNGAEKDAGNDKQQENITPHGACAERNQCCQKKKCDRCEFQNHVVSFSAALSDTNLPVGQCTTQARLVSNFISCNGLSPALQGKKNPFRKRDSFYVKSGFPTASPSPTL